MQEAQISARAHTVPNQVLGCWGLKHNSVPHSQRKEYVDTIINKWEWEEQSQIQEMSWLHLCSQTTTNSSLGQGEAVWFKGNLLIHLLHCIWLSLDPKHYVPNLGCNCSSHCWFYWWAGSCGKFVGVWPKQESAEDSSPCLIKHKTKLPIICCVLKIFSCQSVQHCGSRKSRSKNNVYYRNNPSPFCFYILITRIIVSIVSVQRCSGSHPIISKCKQLIS